MSDDEFVKLPDVLSQKEKVVEAAEEWARIYSLPAVVGDRHGLMHAANKLWSSVEHLQDLRVRLQ